MCLEVKKRKGGGREKKGGREGEDRDVTAQM